MTRIVFIALAIGGMTAFVGHRHMSWPETDDQSDVDLTRLAEASRETALASSGLTPCDRDARAWLARGRTILAAHVRTRPEAVVVIAPTFDDIRVLAVSSEGVVALVLAGTTAFGPGFVSGDDIRPSLVPGPDIPRHLRQRFVAAVLRQVSNAGTYPRAGKDGVRFYFGADDQSCALAWTPHPDSVGGRLAAIATQLAHGERSSPALQESLLRLESLERSLAPGHGRG